MNIIRTLFSKPDIDNRIRALGQELTEFYQGKPLTAVVLLNGAMFFAADLLRHVKTELFVDSVCAGSYVGNQSSGQVNFRSGLKLPVTSRHVLLVDDILDTGVTLAAVKAEMEKQGALSVRTCVMLDKKRQRSAAGLASADWCAFEVPDVYIVGYGLDADELYRNDPEIKYMENPGREL